MAVIGQAVVRIFATPDGPRAELSWRDHDHASVVQGPEAVEHLLFRAQLLAFRQESEVTVYLEPGVVWDPAWGTLEPQSPEATPPQRRR